MRAKATQRHNGAARFYRTSGRDICKHGITYVIDCLLHGSLGLYLRPTFPERKTEPLPHEHRAACLASATALHIGRERRV